MSLVVVHRLTISYPKLWRGPSGTPDNAPDTVQAAAFAARGVLDDDGRVVPYFLDEIAARRASKFWRDQFALGQFSRVQGAGIVLEGSDPVTWPSDGAS